MGLVNSVYLFDMDAVLVHAGGYHAALVATVNHFAEKMGLDAPNLTREEIESFEAAGITSEWDTAPICIAALRLDGGARPDFRALARRIGGEMRKGEFPAETAYRIFEEEKEAEKDGVRLSDLLLHTRDVARSPVTYVFQQFTLGDEFEPTYGLPRTIKTESLLFKFDRPALSKPAPSHSAIYTARPSNPPRDVAPRRGYAPEAELGARLVGLSHLPLIGYGSLQWLAESVGGDAHRYVKPSPAHALAAIGAAAGVRESEALLAAEASIRGEWRPLLRDLCGRRGRVTVFEDSASSIRGVREAAALLGERWECRGIGISAGGPKHEALIKTADRVYSSLDEALEVEMIQPAK